MQLLLLYSVRAPLCSLSLPFPSYATSSLSPYFTAEPKWFPAWRRLTANGTVADPRIVTSALTKESQPSQARECVRPSDLWGLGLCLSERRHVSSNLLLLLLLSRQSHSVWTMFAKPQNTATQMKNIGNVWGLNSSQIQFINLDLKSFPVDSVGL